MYTHQVNTKAKWKYAIYADTEPESVIPPGVPQSVAFIMCVKASQVDKR